MFGLTENDWLTYSELIHLRDEILNANPLNPRILELRKILEELDKRYEPSSKINKTL